ncbi:hypothetical protein E3E35_09220 [Thermococcus sp. GR7]|uniref:hypothetical protein n=1 Tax=unclassified Thermococcus TaxID=2627626 RepID=UPI00143136F3|nr:MULTISPECIES: hypothetical protein [unclassified Thermococcus]NJE47572.1 hypothetical protein [Thermococcus sp. GR7]NJE79336.1 hypothetical protein [Thermococcus sp. GR4]NJF22472.1 hypothetical protein [Thermococcus sp. GR5]
MGRDMCGAYNLTKHESLYLNLTPWAEDDILEPFRWYYSKQPRIRGLNPRTTAILLTRAETGADTYTTAIYLNHILKAKLTSLQSIASWKRQITAEYIVNTVRKTPKSLTHEGILDVIKSGVENAVNKLSEISIDNMKSKVPHWLIKTHISKALSEHTISLIEWTSDNSRYDIYLPLENVTVEVKYVWGYTINYREYTKKNKDIYVIVGENVSQEKLKRISETKGINYILYRTDYGRFFSNHEDIGE